jgi:hypothetical protein
MATTMTNQQIARIYHIAHVLATSQSDHRTRIARRELIEVVEEIVREHRKDAAVNALRAVDVAS